MAAPSAGATLRAAVQALVQSALRTSALHEFMNDGHASVSASWLQPGKALKVDGVIRGAGSGFGGGSGAGSGGVTTLTGGGMMTGGGAGVGGGVVVQAASDNATAPSETSKLLRRVDNIRIDMWLLMIEAGVALFLLVFIVWWTMYAPPPKETGDQPDEKPAAPAEEKPPGDQDR